MKKILVPILALVLSLNAVSAFTTVQLDSANTLALEGIINDNSATPSNYNLDQNVLRQEIAAVARGVAGLSKTGSCASTFSDVWATVPNTWACLSVEALVNADLIAANDTFRPEDNITKAEGLGMLVKAACGDDYSFNANQSGTWQEQVVAYAAGEAIVSNFTDYNTNATRGWVFEAAANAMVSCGEDKEALDILEELLEGIG